MNRHSRRRLELQIQRYLAFWAIVDEGRRR